MKAQHSVWIMFFIIFSFSCTYSKPDILAYTVDPILQPIQLFWKKENGGLIKSLGNLKQHIEGKNKTLQFAMNGGMYDELNKPIGLYVENGNELNKLNTRQVKPNKNGEIPNFYIQPNGVFYITDKNEAIICKTNKFPLAHNIKYATQSGPLLVIDSLINSAFKKESVNRQIRNGVGILPNKSVVFAMSKGKINFYDFADYFRSKGCKYALFLDGGISKTYLPDQKWTELGGDFGVMIGVVK